MWRVAATIRIGGNICVINCRNNIEICPEEGQSRLVRVTRNAEENVGDQVGLLCRRTGNVKRPYPIAQLLYVDHAVDAAREASIHRPGNPASAGKVSPSALLTRNGGRYGAAHRAPQTPPDLTLWPPADFAALVEAFHASGFRPANAWYLHDTANIAYAHAAPDGGDLRQPVLFINGGWDLICDVTRGRLGEPMRRACRALSVTNLEAGHWLPLERKTESVQAIRSWLKTKTL
jgi:pimeloyl-ACP methyl ester carboxylesterase